MYIYSLGLGAYPSLVKDALHYRLCFRELPAPWFEIVGHVHQVVSETLFLEDVFGHEFGVGWLGSKRSDTDGTTDGWLGDGDPSFACQFGDGPETRIRLRVDVELRCARSTELDNSILVKCPFTEEMKVAVGQGSVAIHRIEPGLPVVVGLECSAVCENPLGLMVFHPPFNVFRCYLVEVSSGGSRGCLERRQSVQGTVLIELVILAIYTMTISIGVRNTAIHRDAWGRRAQRYISWGRELPALAYSISNVFQVCLTKGALGLSQQ